MRNYNNMADLNTINPATGKSNAQLMAESNAVAAKASALIGGTWNSGYFKNDGTAVGGSFTPKVTSSDSVLNQRDTKEMINQAGNALTSSNFENSQFNPFSLSPLQQNQYNVAVENQIDRAGSALSAFDAVDVSFDARLGRINQQYNNQMQDLKQSFQVQKDIATQQAAALNPYSQAQGAMTARSFQGAIENEYQKQAQRLTEAAQIAQNELEAGRYEAYTNIQNAMEESNRQFKSNMAKFMLDAQSQYNQAQQQERQFGLDVAKFGLQQQEFGLQQQEFGESRFMDFVSQFNQDPTFRANLDMYYQTGEINEGLMPLIERGFAAGYKSPEEILAVAEYQTTQQRQWQEQMNLNWYQAETSRINALKTAGGGNPTSNTSTIDPTLEKALQVALTRKSYTAQQRADVINLFQNYGLEGALAWAYGQLGEADKKAFDATDNMVNVVSSVAQQIENADTSFGPYKRLAESAKPWLLIQQDTEYASVFGQLEAVQLPLRNAVLGAAITENETRFAKNYFIDPGDSFEVLKVKLNGMAALGQFANDRKAARQLGMEDSVKIEDYIDTRGPEAVLQKQQEEAARNVIWGVPGSNASVSDIDISNWWNQ